jgi:hypothetical protein
LPKFGSISTAEPSSHLKNGNTEYIDGFLLLSFWPFEVFSSASFPSPIPHENALHPKVFQPKIYFGFIPQLKKENILRPWIENGELIESSIGE